MLAEKQRVLSSMELSALITLWPIFVASVLGVIKASHHHQTKYDTDTQQTVHFDFFFFTSTGIRVKIIYLSFAWGCYAEREVLSICLSKSQPFEMKA